MEGSSNKEKLIKIMIKRHKKQENYRGFQEPTRQTHKTGIVAICANCHRPWPCDVRLLLDVL